MNTLPSSVRSRTVGGVLRRPGGALPVLGLAWVVGCSASSTAPASSRGAVQVVKAQASSSAKEAPSDLVEPPVEVPPVARLPLEHQLRIDQAVRAELKKKTLPGAVVMIGTSKGLLFRRAYGHRALQPTSRPMSPRTVFDLASLTKPMVTATAIMILAERGRLRLDDSVASHIPEFAERGKKAVTIRHLLTHTSGLPSVNSLSEYEEGPHQALRRIFASRLERPPLERFVYSDLGYIVLGALVERVSGQDLATFARRHIFRPLKMHTTGFLPSPALRELAAPTEQRDDVWIQGDVHDPRAWRLGGVAGNAGLFSTADDISRFARMILNNGTLNDAQVMKPETVEAMLSRQWTAGGAGGWRALGWDMRTAYSHNKGVRLSWRAVGHGGYTGTCLWIDPAQDLFVLFLSNRVHPNGKGDIRPLARAVRRIAFNDAKALPRGPWLEQAPVLTGIDVLRRDNWKLLQGQRIGLITNVSGRARDGKSTLELLHGAPEVHLIRLFSPEHGLGAHQEGHVQDAQDPLTGLDVVSLFGRNRRPSQEALRDLDALVFDIQDVGTRFYTYTSTMREAMEAAAEAGVRFVVLDRPNPLGGVAVEGPVLDEDELSFVNHHPLPVRHGMTIGELAQLFNEQKNIGVELHVVKMQGWERQWLYDDTGLAWIAPSPNIRNMHEALLYPAVGLLEATNLSVGRGTATPFEVIGAPWLRSTELLEALHEADLPGVRFEGISFRPRARPYAWRPCRGIKLIIEDTKRFRPIQTGLTLAIHLRELHPKRWAFDKLQKLLGDDRVFAALHEGSLLPEQSAAIWQQELAAFRKARSEHLLYPAAAINDRPASPRRSPTPQGSRKARADHASTEPTDHETPKQSSGLSAQQPPT